MDAQESQSTGEFLDTPYGHQLHAGFGRLLFAKGLEQEFRHYLQDQALASQRLGALLLLLVVSLYLYAEVSFLVMGDPEWIVELVMLRGCQALVGLMVLGLTFSGRHARTLAQWFYPLALLLVGAIAARIDIHYTAVEQALSFRYGAGLLIVCAFVFLGITFWRSLVSASLIVLVDLAMAFSILRPAQMPEHWIAISYYVLLLFIGAIGRYGHEYSQREQFLVRKLLGWVAEHDALTGLANRRSYDGSLRRLAALAHREGRALTLMLLDLDNFKAYNDLLGHPAGDELLRRFAGLLAGFARRPLDVAARVGGEEFSLLLYDCDGEAAARLADQIRQALKDSGLQHPAEAKGTPITVSIGIAVLAPEQSEGALYKRADTALYQAKQAGKDRFVLHGPEPMLP
ncbi:GGDEF domain-containing protein [Stutzerimonas nosocomialis]|uniref:diguanylate cyclase n=1 Tax=Stutzerimonas nosocomialis TaxID=1056496 RepID=A0A5R9QBG2_9GAMM|nr:GGDEF domain-containing protein [Stutzerimonas nosocomialis]TLX62228.1 GGDEF domain-containing protein [Stutzerimonas nosocomialis]